MKYKSSILKLLFKDKTKQSNRQRAGCGLWGDVCQSLFETPATQVRARDWQPHMEGHMRRRPTVTFLPRTCARRCVRGGRGGDVGPKAAQTGEGAEVARPRPVALLQARQPRGGRWSCQEASRSPVPRGRQVSAQRPSRWAPSWRKRKEGGWADLPQLLLSVQALSRIPE